MLLHHAHEEGAQNSGFSPAPNPSPAMSHITPQELAQAIVSVETRQQANAPTPTQPVTLEAAIRQLELTVTPEELLTELRAQRTATHRKAVMSPRKAKRSLSWWLMLTGFALSMVTTIFVSFLLYALTQKYTELWKDALALRGPGSSQIVPISPYGLRPLTAFNPHDPAYVSFKDLQALANGASPARIMGAQWSNVSPGATWGVERENGRYVVRADSLRTSANASDKTEWVTPSAAGGEINFTEILPVTRFKHIKGIKSVHTPPYPSTEQILILRGGEEGH